jgi:excisionase family DNA binding protein
MAVFGRSRAKQPETENRVLDVTASMEGSLVFQEPVNLRISGRFEGSLETRGELMVGEKARIRADITGEVITIAGRVDGKIVARQSLKIIPPAVIRGEISTPLLEVEAGAWLEGHVRMAGQGGALSLQEVAEYLEVEGRVVEQWVREGKIPASQEGGQWRFERVKIDEWVAAQRNS